MTSANKMKTVLFAASSGGHWEQLLLIASDLEGLDIHFACTDYSQLRRVPPRKFHVITDCNQHQILKCLNSFLFSMHLIIKIKPLAIVSTGAAPGLMLMVAGMILGCKRRIWIDSVANSEKLSLSGKIARKVCTTTYTQWEHLTEVGKVQYAGRVL